MKKNEIKRLEFSICLNECEDFSYEVLSDYGDFEEQGDDIEYNDVNKYIHSLIGKVDKFFIGEHRTYGNIYYYDNDTMDIHFHDYPNPDWDKQKHYKVNNVKSILPNF